MVRREYYEPDAFCAFARPWDLRQSLNLPTSYDRLLIFPGTGSQGLTNTGVRLPRQKVIETKVRATARAGRWREGAERDVGDKQEVAGRGAGGCCWTASPGGFGSWIEVTFLHGSRPNNLQLPCCQRRGQPGGLVLEPKQGKEGVSTPDPPAPLSPGVPRAPSPPPFLSRLKIGPEPG